MKEEEPLAIEPHYERGSILEYAEYVLDDREVKNFIAKFMRYRNFADKMADSLTASIDMKIVKVNDDDVEMVDTYLRTLDESKNQELRRLIETMIPSEWRKLNIKEIVTQDANAPHPNITDVPLIMFSQFAKNPVYGSYLFTDTINLLDSVYFRKEIALERQKYLVFAIFLWNYTVAYPLTIGKTSIHYYDVPDDSIFIVRRHEFLLRFSKYIHFDLIKSSDYLSKGKEDTILRLDLTRPHTGMVIIQSCTESSSVCNRFYSVDHDLKNLIDKYLSPDSTLKKLESFFQCYKCGQHTACLFVPYKTETRFYCNSHCFRASLTSGNAK